MKLQCILENKKDAFRELIIYKYFIKPKLR
jgi:hypothetical protein